MAFFKCFTCMATIFLVISSISFNGSNADNALIDSICKQSQDYKFCTTAVGNDPRVATVDLHGLALVSISVAAIQIQETLDRIPKILQHLRYPLAKSRLRVCQTDYNEALGNYQSTFTTTSQYAFFDAINFLRIGANKVIECHNSYRMNGPIATSPIGEDMKVYKLSGIIMIAIDRLIPRK